MKDNHVNNQRFVYCCERFKPEGINTVKSIDCQLIAYGTLLSTYLTRHQQRLNYFTFLKFLFCLMSTTSDVLKIAATDFIHNIVKNSRYVCLSTD